MKTEIKRKLIIGMAVPALGLAGWGAWAADPAGNERGAAARPGSSVESESTAGMANRNLGRDMRASKLIGADVKNPQGESLGEIKDLIVDVKNERVHYAVLAMGGALGMGEKLFAYPINLFSRAADRDQLVLNVDKDRLKAAPGFESKQWPDWNRDKYGSEVDRYYGPTVSVKPLPDQQLVRASELIGRDIDDRQGKDAGEIDDVVVNLGNGRVHYAVVKFEKAWSANDKLLPMSLQTLTFPADRKKDLVLNVPREQLNMARGFDKNRWPDVGDPAYQREVDTYIGSASTTSRTGTGTR